MFIQENRVWELLRNKHRITEDDVKNLILKSQNKEVLTPEEIAMLVNLEDKNLLKLLYAEAQRVKQDIYGNRVVLFAPLYVSDFCVNNCSYCGYRRDNKFSRRALSKSEIKEEVKILEKLGHKRLALEIGEDMRNYPFDDILSSIDTIYENSSIRRINVNIAPVSVENFKRLKEKEIGTYILFQETYLQSNYDKYHLKSLKGNYERQLYAHHKAMEAGIDDVGGGVLFGLSPYKFDLMSLILHNTELEKTFGVGFHTVSVPRLQKAAGMDLTDYKNIVTDDEFRKIVAILRIAMPHLGIILSTRETVAMRQELIDLGVTQISAGSQTGVGGYKEADEDSGSQFMVNDERSPLEVIKDLVSRGYLPSYCTACYRNGRTGTKFMNIVRSGKIQHICQPNALLTFAEYIEDYGDKILKDIGYKFIEEELAKIEKLSFRESIKNKILMIKAGSRDLYV